MNVAKHTIAIFIIVGISGLLYTSSFLPSVFAQNTTNTGNWLTTTRRRNI